MPGWPCLSINSLLLADRLSANPSQFLRERLIESPRLRHRPPRDPFTTSGGYCTWRVRQIK